MEPRSSLLDYEFKNKKLLQQALTHTSRARDRKQYHFERMEFLGDRILGLVLAEMLYQNFPHEREGKMAQKLAYLGSREICKEIALTMKLDRLVHFRHTDSAQTINKSLLGNALEAVLAAMYLDSGSIEPCRKLIQKYWTPYLEITQFRDPKACLQEWCQKHNLPLPTYELIKQEGEQHAPIFTVTADVAGQQEIQSGTSKKQAEKLAAEKLLLRLRKK